MILKDPAWAQDVGLITTKAQLTAETADCTAYIDLLTQATAVGGLIIFGLLGIWVFGREYSDRTIIDLLAVPIPRHLIVGAKFVVIACWSVVLVMLIYVLGIGVGLLVDLPGWSTDLLWTTAGELMIAGGMTVIVTTPFAWAASVGRGCLAPIGVMFLVLFLSQILAALGWGAVFPWAAPALPSGAAGTAGANLPVGSYLLVLLTGLSGTIGTMWWRSRDYTR